MATGEYDFVLNEPVWFDIVIQEDNKAKTITIYGIVDGTTSWGTSMVKYFNLETGQTEYKEFQNVNLKSIFKNRKQPTNGR